MLRRSLHIDVEHVVVRSCHEPFGQDLQILSTINFCKGSQTVRNKHLPEYTGEGSVIQQHQRNNAHHPEAILITILIWWKNQVVMSSITRLNIRDMSRKGECMLRLQPACLLQSQLMETPCSQNRCITRILWIEVRFVTFSHMPECVSAAGYCSILWQRRS